MPSVDVSDLHIRVKKFFPHSNVVISSEYPYVGTNELTFLVAILNSLESAEKLPYADTIRIEKSEFRESVSIECGWERRPFFLPNGDAWKVMAKFYGNPKTTDK